MRRKYLRVPYAQRLVASRSGRADKRNAQGTVSVPYCLLPTAYCLLPIAYCLVYIYYTTISVFVNANFY